MPLISLSHSSIPPALHGSLLTDKSLGSLPRYWASVWLALDGAGLATNTLRKKLSAIEGLYRTAERVLSYDGLDRVIAVHDFDNIERILTSRFVELQNDVVRRQVDNTSAWQDSFGFVRSILQRICYSEKENDALTEVRKRLLRLDQQFRSLHPTANRKRPMALRSLPASVVTEIYEIIHPNSARNPFRTEAQKWRNFLLLLLLLHQGLRRGEALLLTVDSIQTGNSPIACNKAHWLNVTDSQSEDHRYQNRPSIKTRYSHRQIPVSTTVMNVWNNFVGNYRGRQAYPYLFLNNRGKPLSGNAPGRILAIVTNALTPKAKRDLKSINESELITPHDLRHTCAVLRISQFRSLNEPEDLSFEKMRAYFGWSYTSEMPRHYARAYFETELATTWNDRFDGDIEALRKISQFRIGQSYE